MLNQLDNTILALLEIIELQAKKNSSDSIPEILPELVKATAELIKASN